MLCLAAQASVFAATKTWTGAGDGVNWSSAGNWSPSAPATGDDVVIPDLAGSPTLVYSTGTLQINSLTAGELLNLTGGVLQIATTFQTSKNVTLAGGTIKGGVLSATGGATLTMPINNGGTLDGVTLASDFTVARNSTLTVKNGLTLNNAKLIISSDLAGYTQNVIFSGTQTLGGTGQVVFGGLSNINNMYAQGNGTMAGAAVLTIGANVTVHGTQGGGLANWHSFDSVVNQGTISADTAGQTITLSGPFTNQATVSAVGGNLTINGVWTSSATITGSGGGSLNLGGSTNAWTNTGTITTNNVTVNLGGSFSVAALGTFNRTGGTVNLAGTLNNAAATLALTATTGSWQLTGGTVLGGTITAVGGATFLLPANNGGTLDGVTLAADFTVSRNATLTVKNGMTLNSGKLIFSSDLAGYTQTIVFTGTGTQTLGGTGQVLFAGSSNINNIYAQGNGTMAGAAVLTIGTGVTIHGTQGGGLANWHSFDSVVNQGLINADTAGQTITIGGPFTNQGTGTVSATGGSISLTGTWTNSGAITGSGGGTLNLGSGTNAWTNTGTITTNNVTVNLGGSFSVAALGTFNRTGGTVNLTGTLNNAAATLALTATTGSWQLTGGTVLGGTITGAGGATFLLPANNGGTLDGVTLAADFTVSRNATLTVKNGMTLNNGRLIFSSDLAGYTQTVVFTGTGTQTLGGTGEVLFAGLSNINNVYAQGNNTVAGAAVLTIGPGVTVHGTQGGSLANWYTPDSVVNQGLINADTAGQTITIAGTFTNQGTGKVWATGGSISLTGTWTNNATIMASGGGSLNLGSGTNAWTNNGTITTNNVTVNLGGSFSVLALGTFNRTGGTVTVTGTLNNNAATLALTAATGSWQVSGGTINGGTVTGSGGAGLLLPANSGATLDGVTLGSDFTVSRNATLAVKNGLTLDHSKLIFSSDLAGYTQTVVFQGTQTLGGTGGEVVFGGLSNINNIYIQGNNTMAGAAVLTITNGVTVHGTQGGSVQIYYGFDSIINEGAITADAAGQTITVVGPFTNRTTGTVATTAGSMSLFGTWTNSAAINATVGAGTLNLGNGTNAWTNTGTITASNATVNLGGSFSVAALGTFNRTTGTVNLTGTLNNIAATLGLNAATGSWVIAGGRSKAARSRAPADRACPWQLAAAVPWKTE